MPSETQLLNWARNIDSERDKNPGYLHAFARNENLDPQIFYDILPSIEEDDWGTAELLNHQVGEQRIIDILIERAVPKVQEKAPNVQAKEVLDYIQTLNYYSFSTEQEGRLGKDPELPSQSSNHKLKARLTTIKEPQSSSSGLSSPPSDLSDSSETSDIPCPIYGKITRLDEARSEMTYGVSQRLMNALDRHGGLHELAKVLRSGELQWAATPIGDAGVKPLKGFDDSFEYKQYVVGEQRVLGNEVDVEGTKVLIFFKYSSHANIKNYAPNYNLPALAVLDKGFDHPAFVNFAFDKEQQAESLPTCKLSAPPHKPLAQKITEQAPSLKEPHFLGLDSSKEDKLFEASIRDHQTLENEIEYHAQCIIGQAVYLYKAETFYIRIRLLIEASSTGQLKDHSFKSFGILMQHYIETFAKKSADIDENSGSTKYLLEECKKIQSLVDKNPNSKNIDSGLLQNLQESLENIENTLAGFHLSRYAKLISEEQNANKENVQNICTYFTNKALTTTQQEHLAALHAYLAPKPPASTITASPPVLPSALHPAHPPAAPSVLALPQPNVNTLKDTMFSDISAYNIASTISYFIAVTRYNACLSAHMIVHDKYQFKNAINALCSTDYKTEEWWKWGYILIQYGKFSLIFPIHLALALTGIKGLTYTSTRWMLRVEHDNIIAALTLGAFVGMLEPWATKTAAVFTIAKLGKMTLAEANEILLEAPLLSLVGLGNVIAHASFFAANYLITHGKTIILQPGSEESMIIYSMPWVAGSAAFIALSLFGGYGLMAALCVALRTVDIASLAVNLYVYSEYGVSTLAAELLLHAEQGNRELAINRLNELSPYRLEEIGEELFELHRNLSFKDHSTAKNVYETLKLLKTEYNIVPHKTIFKIIEAKLINPTDTSVKSTDVQWLLAAITYGDIDPAKQFLIDHPNYLNEWDSQFYFMIALYFRYFDVFSLLVEHLDKFSQIKQVILMNILLSINTGTRQIVFENNHYSMRAGLTESEALPYVKTMLDAGTNPNYIDKEGIPGICGVAVLGLVNIAKLFIEHGADLSRSCLGKSVVQAAIENNFYNVATVFITSGFRMYSAEKLKEEQASNLAKYLNEFLEVNVNDAYGAVHACSVIQILKAGHVSIKGRCTNMIAQLLELFKSIQNGNLEAVKSFVQEHPEFLYFEYKMKNTLITKAIEHNQYQIFSWLLSYQKTLSNKHIGPSQIQIMAADLRTAASVSHGRKYVKALLDNGADPNFGDQDKPLHWSAKLGSIQIINTLLSYQADINNESGSTGVTPLDMAIRNGRVSAAIFLIIHGAQIESTLCFNKVSQLDNAARLYELAEKLVERINIQEADLKPLVNTCKSLTTLKNKKIFTDKMPPVCAGALAETAGNLKQAEMKYKSAAANGDAESMYRLGQLYERQANKDDAIPLYNSASAKGHALSQWLLLLKKKYVPAKEMGSIIDLLDSNGFGVARDLREGISNIIKEDFKVGKHRFIEGCEKETFDHSCELLAGIEECENKYPDKVSVITCFKEHPIAKNLQDTLSGLMNFSEQFKSHLE